MNQRIPTAARLLLACIRLINGTVGLFAPQLILRQLGNDLTRYPAAHYILRMFGIRTILIALDLFRTEAPGHEQAVRLAPVIHASDTIVAVLAARAGTLPPATVKSIVSISAINTLLAVLMQPRRLRR